MTDFYRCPYCNDEELYESGELIQHLDYGHDQENVDIESVVNRYRSIGIEIIVQR